MQITQISLQSFNRITDRGQIIGFVCQRRIQMDVFMQNYNLHLILCQIHKSKNNQHSHISTAAVIQE